MPNGVEIALTALGVATVAILTVEAAQRVDITLRQQLAGQLASAQRPQQQAQNHNERQQVQRLLSQLERQRAEHQIEVAKMERKHGIQLAKAQMKTAVFLAQRGPFVKIGPGKIASNCASYMEVRLAEVNRDARMHQDSYIKVYSPFYDLCDGAMLRVIFVSQVDSDEEHFLFAMYNYEYPDHPGVSQINTGRVYVGYLDGTAHYLRKDGRPQLYQDIMNAYLEYASSIGLKKAHIWAAPPMDPDENWYIFRNSEGSTHSTKGLIKYYRDFCRRFHWDVEAGIHTDNNGNVLKFPGDIKNKKSQYPPAQQKEICKSLLVIDLTSHMMAGQFVDVSATWMEESALQQCMVESETLNFDNLDNNRQSTSKLLTAWKNQGMPQHAVMPGSVWRGVDITFKEARKKAMRANSSRKTKVGDHSAATNAGTAKRAKQK